MRSADRDPTRRGDNGLTLIEMLIVLAIIAVAAGATVLSLAPRRGSVAEAEARQLATAIQRAVDRSIATGARDALTIDATGYTVGAGARHALPPETALSGAAGPVQPLGFDGGRPFDVVVTHGGDRWIVSFDGLRAVAAPAKDGA